MARLWDDLRRDLFSTPSGRVFGDLDLDSVVVVDCTQIEFRIEEENDPKGLPLLAPPFDRAFYEFETPKGVQDSYVTMTSPDNGFSATRRPGDLLPRRWGVLELPGDRLPAEMENYILWNNEAWLVERHRDFLGRTGGFYRLSLIIREKDRTRMNRVAGLCGYWVQEDGTWQEGYLIVPDLGLDRIMPEKGLEDEWVWRCLVQRMHMSAWFAISLLHCKNVEQRITTPDPNRKKKWKKKYGIEPVSYRTLVVKNTGRTGGGAGNPGERYLGPLSLVRGHFRTYTADKPMFGRVAGTFFVPQHCRGSRDVGEVVKDYQVKV